MAKTVETYKKEYKDKIKKYAKGVRKGDEDHWNNVVLLIENELEGPDWVMHDENMQCSDGQKISREMANRGHWKGRVVKPKQINERADGVYKMLFRRLQQEFRKYNDTLKKKR